MATGTEKWLLLVHQLPAKPDYLRAKIGRRLARLGAVAIKNSVYVLPNDGERVEDLQWLLREIADGGGEATLAAARLLGGIDDAQVEELFRAARDGDCAGVLAEARALYDSGTPQDLESFDAQRARLQRRHDEIAAIDFFGSVRRLELEGVLRSLREVVEPGGALRKGGELQRGTTWVTRRGIKIDRMASAWLIRRFLDPDARFKFVEAKGYAPERNEVRFDMFDAEYSHEGDGCTFEVLVRRFELRDKGLRPLAEIVHDIDLKDEKFGRAEAPGIAMVVDAIANANPDDDDARLASAAAIFDDLFEHLGRSRRG